MGRYYSGDIEGKFWFALQSSDAASRFGGQMYEPQYIEYYFGPEHLDEVNAEIDRIITKLGDKKERLDEFFDNCMGYRDEDIEALGISREELSDYADLGLGIKIRDCMLEHGQCQFEAEI